MPEQSFEGAEAQEPVNHYSEAMIALGGLGFADDEKYRRATLLSQVEAVVSELNQASEAGEITAQTAEVFTTGAIQRAIEIAKSRKDWKGSGVIARHIEEFNTPKAAEEVPAEPTPAEEPKPADTSTLAMSGAKS